MIPEIFNIQVSTLPPIETREVPCILCNERNITSVNTFQLNSKRFCTVRCDTDGMMWLDPQPTQSFYDYVYQNLYHKTSISDPLYEQATLDVNRYNDNIYQQIAKIRLDSIEKYKQKGEILEIGFGQPHTLFEAKKRGWKPFGIESDKGCIEILKKNNIDGMIGTIFALTVNNQFSVVAMYSVLEHVLDPRAYLKKIHEILEPEGLLVLRLPDTESSGPPASLIAHVYHFNAHTIMVFLRKNGFDPICIDSFNKWEPQKYSGHLWNMNIYSKKINKKT